MKVIGKSRFLVSVLSLVFGTTAAFAAEFCVTSPRELQAALAIAHVNGESDVERLEGGLYHIDESELKYDVVSPGNADVHHDLVIEGGWESSPATR